MKSGRKIRQTNELICFTSPTKENICPINLSNIKESLNKTNATKRREILNSDNHFQSFVNNRDNLSTDDESNLEQSKFSLTENPNSDLTRNDVKKRKIIKAKRFFKGHTETKEENLHTHTDAPVLGESHSSVQNIDSKLTEFTSHGESFNNENEQEKLSNTLNVIIETLSSPVSPSLSSAENVSSPQHFHFNSSREDLQPSTEGAVESSSKRRTYELEDSVIDISLLKSMSEQDSSRINSSSSGQDLTENETPKDHKYRKVTIRRKWDKVNYFSPAHIIDGYMFSSDRKCTSELRSQNSLLLSKSVEREQPKAKKFVSKIKMPNFSAIHEKAQNKIESITEYQQRKDQRAQLLLSGRKPIALNLSIKKEKNRKQLRFAPNISTKEKSPTFIPLPSTPLPKYQVCNESPLFSQISRFKKENKATYPEMKQNLWEKKASTANNKESHIPKKINPPLENVKSGKLNVPRYNEIKSIVTKSKPAMNTLETRRHTIKGVRSNRRFELLMNMRKGK